MYIYREREMCIYLSNLKTCILPVLQCLWLWGPSSFCSIFLCILGEVWQEIRQVHTMIALSHICAGWFGYGVGCKRAEVWFQLQYRACLLLAKLLHYEGCCWYNTSSMSFGKLDWHIESLRMCVCTKSIKCARAYLQCHSDKERESGNVCKRWLRQIYMQVRLISIPQNFCSLSKKPGECLGIGALECSHRAAGAPAPLRRLGGRVPPTAGRAKEQALREGAGAKMLQCTTAGRAWLSSSPSRQSLKWKWAEDFPVTLPGS